MAKPLVFHWSDRQFSFEMTKVDRTKLYGFKETEVLDDRGERCVLATLAQDGHTVIGRGGTGLGNLTVDGMWIEKSQLTPVDPLGQKLQPVASSFSAPVALTNEVSINDYLDCAVRAIYVLQSLDNAESLIDELKRGTIFRFAYSYRGGLEPDTAFLLTNSEGSVFLAVAKPSKVEFLGLQQMAAAVEDDEQSIEDDDMDAMDFSMM